MLEFMCKFLASIGISASNFRILGNYLGGCSTSCYTFSKDRSRLLYNTFHLFLHPPLDFVFVFRQGITFLLIKVKIVMFREPRKNLQLFTWLFFLVHWPLGFESKLCKVIQEWSLDLALFVTFVFVSVTLLSIHLPLGGAAIVVGWHVLLSWVALALLWHLVLIGVPLLESNAFLLNLLGVYVSTSSAFTIVGVPWLANGARLCLGGVLTHPFDISDLIGVPLASSSAFRLIRVAPWVGAMLSFVGVALEQALICKSM